LKDALDDYNGSVRRAACWALGQIRDPAAVEALVECARDQDHRIRCAACAALGNIGDPAAVSTLKAALADSNVNVRNAAEEALKNITNQGVVDITAECTNGQMHSVSVKVSNWGSWEVIDSTCMQTLGQAFGRMAPCYHRVMERSLEVRRSVISALGRKGRSGVSALIGALADSEVRALACQMLGQIGDKVAVPALIEQLEDTTSDVRKAACTALGQIRDPSAVPALIACLDQRDISQPAANALVQIGKPAVPALIEALTSPSNRVRIAACTALGLIGDIAAIPALRVHAEVMEEAQYALAKLGGTSMALQEAVRSLAEQSLWGVLCRALTSNLVRDAIVQLGCRAVPALIDALRDDDPKILQAACRALEHIGDTAAFPALRVHADVMEEALQALAKLGGSTFPLQQAVRTLAEQSLWGVLCRALTGDQVRDAIVQLGSRAVPALIDALRDDDPRIRQAACTALGQIGDPAAVPELTKRLQDSVSDVRIAACTALGQIGDSSAVPELIKCLEDTDYDVRIAACTALGKIGDPSPVPVLITCLDYWYISQAAANALIQIGKPAVPALIETLTDPNERVRKAACTALGQIGDSIAVPELIQCLKDRYSDVSIAACTALGQIGDSIAVPELIQCLKYRYSDVSIAACTALGQIGDSVAVPELIQCLKDRYSDVSIAACTALGQIGDASAVPALIACLDDISVDYHNYYTNDADIYKAATNALVQIGEAAVPALNEALKSENDFVRSAAYIALGQIRESSAIPELIQCLKNTYPEVRIAACTALGHIGDSSAVPELIKCLKDTDYDVRIAACTALGHIGDSSAVPELIKCLKDTDYDVRIADVRIAACTALGHIGDASAVPALIACLDDNSANHFKYDADSYKAATNALVQIGEPAVPALIEILTNPNERVRSAACTALGQIGDISAIPALRVHAEVMQDARQALTKLGGTSMSLLEAAGTLAEQSQWGVLCRALTSNLVRAAIVQLGNSAVPALIVALRDDDPKIRQAACTALGQIGDPSPVPALIACLDQQDISEAAANALVQIGKPAVPALIRAITRPSSRVRCAACTALGQIGDTAAVPVLIQRLEDADSNVRSAACTALGQIGDAAAIPALRVHAELMEEARHALYKLGGTSMSLQEAVRTLSEQNQWGVLSRALTSNKFRDAIVQLGSSAVPALIDVLRDVDPKIRQAACNALGQIGDPSAIPALIACLGDVETTDAAINALVHIGKPALPTLIEALTSPSNRVRSAACTALGLIRDSVAVPEIIGLLTDVVRDVRYAACSALRQIGGKTAMSALRIQAEIMTEAQQELDMLGDSSIPLHEALRTLAEHELWGAIISALGGRQVRTAVVQLGTIMLPALMYALKVKDWSIRLGACTALRDIGDPSAIPAIVDMLKNESHPHVRIAAEEALKKLRRKGSAGSA
jgi:HEAT repeat protein